MQTCNEVVAPVSARASGRWIRPLTALVTSAVLLGLLLWLLDPASLRRLWSQIEWGYVVVASILFGLNLVARGFRLAYLAGGPAAPWIRVAARHQIIFSILPSGLGDAGFPVIARKLAGIGVWSATRVIIAYRAQDLCALLLLGLSGLLVHRAGGATPVAWLLILMACWIALAWSAGLVRWLARLALFAARRITVLERYAEPLDKMAGVSSPAALTGRLWSAGLTCLGWSLVIGAMWSIFAALTVRLGPAEIMIILAGLNLLGVVAVFTIAGLGVSEGGLAAILLMIGFGGEEALSLAVLVRSASLVMTLLTSLIVDRIVWSLALFGQSPD